MNELILCKYGELALKGLNKANFEKKLQRELAQRLEPIGPFEITRAQSVIYIKPLSEDCDMDEAMHAATHVFGIAGATRAICCEKELPIILKTAQEYLPERLEGIRTFKVESKRADKRFPLTSPELSGEIGGALLDVMPNLRVDVHHPDVTVMAEIRDEGAYLHAGQEKGAGGMPYGSAGKGLLLLSGGIDSPVAGYMMAKRGLALNALHFESFPYTSERARDKVLRLGSILCDYIGELKINVVSVTHIQEELRDKCEEDYFTLLLRRFMMRIANELARKYWCGALVTGESLGQVASQTLDALNVTNSIPDRPVFRPCIGMDKEEIVEIARRIGTFDVSIEPYEDCCTVFTPRHPRTRPDLAKVIAQEQRVDVDALVAEALDSLTVYPV